MDNPNSTILVIDVGNTNTVLGLYHGATLRALWRLTTSREQTADEYGILIHNLFTLGQLSASEISGIMIASVVPPLDLVLAEMAEEVFQDGGSVSGAGNADGYGDSV